MKIYQYCIVEVDDDDELVGLGDSGFVLARDEGDAKVRAAMNAKDTFDLDTHRVVVRPF